MRHRQPQQDLDDDDDRVMKQIQELERAKKQIAITEAFNRKYEAAQKKCEADWKKSKLPWPRPQYLKQQEERRTFEEEEKKRKPK